MWRKQTLLLADTAKRCKKHRDGYACPDGRIAVPPKSARKLDAWKKKMGIALEK